MDIVKKLYSCQDKKYRDLVLKLTPSVMPETVIGVRFPDLKKIASSMNEDEKARFLKDLPHKYFEENNLHSIIISKIKDEEKCIEQIELFLPYIDNWSTSDTISPAVFKKHNSKLIEKIKVWARSNDVYTVRVGVCLLMKFFLDDHFMPEYNDLVCGIVSDEYYINMMCAWYFATALAKQPKHTLSYFEEHKMTETVYKMAVRKCRESYRVPEETKQYLKTL